MEELDRSVEVVRRSALRGACSVTGCKQAIEDAALRTLELWEEALLKGKKIASLEGWAFRVGANAAKRRAGVRPSWPRDLNALVWPGNEYCDNAGQQHDDRRRLLRAQITRKKNVFRGRQLEVLLKMAEPNMTQNLAAKELGMDRANLRRAFKSGLQRVRQPRK